MKYVVVLGDGMADWPIEKLGGKTCLEYAKTPNTDAIAPLSETGLFRTVPDGFKPGSDVANMSVMGFNPSAYYTGRSPLEAVAMGIELKSTDVTMRANLVTLAGEGAYEDMTMADYSAGEITTDEATNSSAISKRSSTATDLNYIPGYPTATALLRKTAKRDMTLPLRTTFPTEKLRNICPRDRMQSVTLP